MKVFFSAYTCKGNTGDILINKLQIEEYARYAETYVDCTGMPSDFYNIIFKTKSPNIKDFVKTYGISYRSKHMLQVLRLIKKEGFTHFTKSPGPYAYIKFPIKTFIIRLIGALGYWIAYKHEMKVIALGIDLNYEKESIWLQKINNRYFSIYNKLGIRSVENTKLLSKSLTNVQYIPDMAFLYPMPIATPEIENRKRVALSFRMVDNIGELTKKLKSICEFFRGRNYDIDIVYQVEKDLEFCQKLNNSMAQYSVSLRQQLIDYNLLNVYTQYAFVFTNRLHVALMGAIHGAIPYAIISHDAKEHKLRCIFDSVFSKHLWCYQDTMDITILEELYAEQQALSQLLRNDISYQHDLCTKAIKHCFKERCF
jgi:hypothetical protein